MAAHRALVVCAPLCFLLKRYDKLEQKLLKSVLSDFYKPEDITAAKYLLETNTEAVVMKEGNQFSSMPRLPRRVNGENRTSKEIDDILKITEFIDENHIVDQLPKFVAESPDDMPYMRVVDSDFRFLVNKIDKMEAMMHDLYTMNGQLSLRLNACLSDKRTSDVNNSAAAAGDVTSRCSMTGGKPTTSHSYIQPPPQQQDVALAKSRQLRASTSSAISQPADDNADEPVDWTQVVSRKKKNKKRRLGSGDQAEAFTTDTDDCGETRQMMRDVVSAPSVASKKMSSKPKSKSNRVLVGKKTEWPVVGSVNQLKVVAAKSYLQKSVFCIDNVNTNVTVEDLERFVVDSLNVKIISCFKVKPRRAKWQKDAGIIPSDRNTFRVCIDRDDEKDFLNENIWPQKIAIFRWTFKKQNQETINNKKDNTVVESHPHSQSPRSPRSVNGRVNVRPAGQSTPSSDDATVSKLTVTDPSRSAGADAVVLDGNETISRWGDAVDMDETEILNCHEHGAEH